MDIVLSQIRKTLSALCDLPKIYRIVLNHFKIHQDWWNLSVVDLIDEVELAAL